MKHSFINPTFKKSGQPDGSDTMHTGVIKKAVCRMPILLASLVFLAGSAATSAQANDNKINGEVPAAPTKCLNNERHVIMHFNNFNGEYVRIEPGIREAGTRSPVHEHPYSGSTCVLQGKMTLTLEGQQDQTFQGDLATGLVECYPMPAPDSSDVNKMAATNTGSGNALIIDIFTVPTGKEPEDFKPMCVLQTGNPSCYTTGSGCEK